MGRDITFLPPSLDADSSARVDCEDRNPPHLPPRGQSHVELWPSTVSIGGDPEYDHFMYAAMAADTHRNDFLLRAFQRSLKGLTVVDVGTGQQATLALLALQAGARKVYAIELLEKPAYRAALLVRKLGLTDRISVIWGDAQAVYLPEPVDACVSDNLGNIGGAEGWDLLLQSARHLVKPGGQFIPGRCQTLVAGVQMPRSLVNNPRFNPVARYYAGRLFERAGYRFDLRLAVSGLQRSMINSTADVFEEINFNEEPVHESRGEIVLTILRDSMLDGFALWVRVETIPGETFESIDKSTASWMPVYFPVFDPPISVRAGDTIRATASSNLADDRINRDYHLAGTVCAKGKPAIEFRHASYCYKPAVSANSFYRRLLRNVW